MPVFISLLLITFSAFSAEVATISVNRLNKNEIVLILTDDSLQQTFEKTFLAKPCVPRSANNNLVALRENSVVQACRAQYVKFLLDNGYKPSLDYRTFSK